MAKLKFHGDIYENNNRVVNQSNASSSTPSAPGTASAGSSTNYARADHVHPAQTTVNGHIVNADVPSDADYVYYVTFTDNNGTITSNKTYTEIYTAASNHKLVMAEYFISNTPLALFYCVSYTGGTLDFVSHIKGYSSPRDLVQKQIGYWTATIWSGQPTTVEINNYEVYGEVSKIIDGTITDGDLDCDNSSWEGFSAYMSEEIDDDPIDAILFVRIPCEDEDVEDYTGYENVDSFIFRLSKAWLTIEDGNFRPTAHLLFVRVSNNQIETYLLEGLKDDSSWSDVTVTHNTIAIGGSGLPSGGTAGQVLTKNSSTDDDASWADIPDAGIFLITATSSGSTYSIDKTWADIGNAYNAGLWPVILYNQQLYPLVHKEGITYYHFRLTQTTAPNSGIPRTTTSGFDIYRNGSTLVVSYITAVNAYGVPTGGSANQVLKKTSNSNYAYGWGDAPIGLPSGGSAGQFLKKNSSTDGDASWADAPSNGETMIVTATGSVYNATMTIDKTFTQISEAIQAGNPVYISIPSESSSEPPHYSLVSATNTKIVFGRSWLDSNNPPVSIYRTLTVNSSNPTTANVSTRSGSFPDKYTRYIFVNYDNGNYTADCNYNIDDFVNGAYDESVLIYNISTLDPGTSDEIYETYVCTKAYTTTDTTDGTVITCHLVFENIQKVGTNVVVKTFALSGEMNQWDWTTVTVTYDEKTIRESARIFYGTSTSVVTSPQEGDICLVYTS